MRSWFRTFARRLTSQLLHLTVTGLDNVPPTGGLLLVMNHLGDADPLLVIGHTPREVEAIGKSEILGWPLIGSVARQYGMVAVRRGSADRAALASALDILRGGKALLVAPEGQESKSGAMIEARGGAAFLAMQSGAPVLPIAITGTERTYANWLRFRRPMVTLTYGAPITLPRTLSRREATELIMRQIAALLPPRYRGVYG